MGRKMVSYRGSLKSCNYRCSYCPFSKHRALASERERDRQQFARFCGSIEERAEAFDIGAVFVAPYGEAAVHQWYWEGLGRLAGLPGICRVGIQTNLSFSVKACMNIFDHYSRGGSGKDTGIISCEEEGASLDKRELNLQNREKLCIWATFHPEMTDINTFADKCHELTALGVSLCAGAVGAPGNLSLLAVLREKLSPDIYLWINKMDGLGRNYTEEERNAFSRIDSFFEQELKVPAADAAMCGERCFVEADGRVHTCNISKAKTVNWYEGSEEEIFRPLCGKRRCSCYLAYGGRADFAGRQFFGEYPLFRIPERRRERKNITWQKGEQ